VETYSGPLYTVLPRGGVLSRFGVGHDGIDKRRAAAAGLFVANTPGVLDDAVTEHALALLLTVAKDIAQFALETQNRQWRPHSTLELRGRTLAIVGCGAIGCRLAHAARVGLGMRVIGCEVRTDQHEPLMQTGDFETVTADLETAVSSADVVSLHVPAVPATRGLIGRQVLAAFRADAILINTARGPVVDEDALFEALAGGRLRAAALDVFEAEPYVPRTPGKDLRTLKNVLMTPHIASNTDAACRRMARRALDNIRAVFNGRPEQADLVVNPELNS